MEDTFYFIFSPTDNPIPPCSKLGLPRALISRIVSSLTLDAMVAADRVAGCQVELVEFIMTDQAELTAEVFFSACITCLTLLKAIDRLDITLQSAGVWISIVPNSDDPQQEATTVRARACDQAEIDAMAAAMDAGGAYYRDFAAEVRTNVKTEIAGSTIH